MKKIFITCLCFFSTMSCFSQTTKQKDLVSSFFTQYGYNMLGGLAHVFPERKGGSVKAGQNHTYFITVNYSPQKTPAYSCEYKLQLDSKGLFKSLAVSKCGEKQEPCFSTCALLGMEVVATELETADKIRYQKYFGKPVADMTCEEYMMVALYFAWLDKEFAENYF